MHYLDLLNEKQREAVLHLGSPLLILAGAGSGKTRVITTKIAWLLDEKGYDPLSILAVTFTNKAADEMKNRVLDLTPRAGNVMIRTFHSFGAWLCRRHAHLIGLPPNFTIYDPDDMIALIKSITEKKTPLSEIKQYANLISRAKDMCLSPEDDLSPFSWASGFDDIYLRYQKRLEEIGNLDFGDLIMKPVRLLRDFPRVKERIRQRFGVILVDEFQDSNGAQFELLSELYGGKTYLCVVGDEDQSIYSFRGAEVKNIVGFADAFPGTTVIMLEQNYRSTATILELATRVVEHNSFRIGKNLWTDNDEGERAVYTRLANQEEEALFCAHLVEDGNFDNTAILYRNNYQSRAFESLFLNLNIPYKIVGTLRFYEREEVKDVLAYLNFCANPRDEVSFRRIVNKPARGIGPRSVETVIGCHAADLLASAAGAIPRLSSKAREALSFFIGIVEESISMLESHTLSEVVHHLIIRSGLYDHYHEKDKMSHTSKVRNLEEIVNATSNYPGGKEGLSAFLETTLLGSNDEDPFLHEGKVTLITVHNTKGLEFDRVIITGLEEGLFPHWREGDDEEEELEEERRLFYVGVTRARKSLYLTSCARRLVFGHYDDRFPSRFLSEIPKKCLAASGDTGGGAYRVGNHVMHPEYGTGIIVGKWYNDEEEMVQVRFSTGREARFIASYSKLERICPDD
ncbi:MAG: UvrD-helicase domain-containing protein [Spirochaetales bacterium]|nr:UvrD-helicase domain-containing protein [Spirochaetales bacterium]